MRRTGWRACPRWQRRGHFHLEHQEPGVAKAVPHRTDLHSPVVLCPAALLLPLREPGYESFLLSCKIEVVGAQRGSQYWVISLTCGELTPWAPGTAGLHTFPDVVTEKVLSEREPGH